ncbi:hypothetical protein MMC06_003633 [Schaereria dolodes]|nr:hypothetical protein [Schaereria dolodes]
MVCDLPRAERIGPHSHDPRRYCFCGLVEPPSIIEGSVEPSLPVPEQQQSPATALYDPGNYSEGAPLHDTTYHSRYRQPSLSYHQGSPYIAEGGSNQVPWTQPMTNGVHNGSLWSTPTHAMVTDSFGLSSQYSPLWTTQHPVSRWPILVNPPHTPTDNMLPQIGIDEYQYQQTQHHDRPFGEMPSSYPMERTWNVDGIHYNANLQGVMRDDSGLATGQSQVNMSVQLEPFTQQLPDHLQRIQPRPESSPRSRNMNDWSTKMSSHQSDASLSERRCIIQADSNAPDNSLAFPSRQQRNSLPSSSTASNNLTNHSPAIRNRVRTRSERIKKKSPVPSKNLGQRPPHHHSSSEGATSAGLFVFNSNMDRTKQRRTRVLSPDGKKHAKKVRQLKACPKCKEKHQKCYHVLPEDLDRVRTGVEDLLLDVVAEPDHSSQGPVGPDHETQPVTPDSSVFTPNTPFTPPATYSPLVK